MEERKVALSLEETEKISGGLMMIASELETESVSPTKTLNLPESYECQICHETFDSKSACDDHMKSAHGYTENIR